MATRKAKPTIRCTRDYRLFVRSTDNRVTDLKKHRRLKESMEQYGFLPSFPIVCHKNGSSIRQVKDGQHRLAIAESLGLPVWYVDEEVDFDVARVNSTAKVWTTQDYALKFSNNGVAAYTEGLEFAKQYKLPVGIAFAMLGGTTHFKNVDPAYVNGQFKVKDRAWANDVAGIYAPMVEMAPRLRNKAFLSACMAACRVSEFEAKRLLQNASRCREKLVNYSTRDACLSMLEEVYNFGRSKLFGLKTAAEMTMRERSATVSSQLKKQAKAK
jgi:hypothetical protein